MLTSILDRAILETLAYSDIFECPLRLVELHRYLSVYVDREVLPIRLRSLIGQVEEMDGFYFLAGHYEFVDVRKQREIKSRALMPHALHYGHLLGSLPFVRMVALTGSLAVLNVSKNVDFDYMLVTVHGRVWIARAFALLFNRLTRLWGYTICPNVIVSEASLRWHQQDLYSARELCQMIPITGMGAYQKLMQVNEWVKEFLPNARQASEVSKTSEALAQKTLELPLRGRLGDRLESWERNRKITRFSKQDGFGEETVFNSDMCQGNFDHHRKWTREQFDKKIMDIDSLLPLGESARARVG